MDDLSLSISYYPLKVTAKSVAAKWDIGWVVFSFSQYKILKAV
jgi:hypothetical protein